MDLYAFSFIFLMNFVGIFVPQQLCPLDYFHFRMNYAQFCKRLSIHIELK